MSTKPVATAIVNTYTGRRSADDVEAILREVLSPHMKLTVIRTRRAGDAIGLGRAAARDSDLVIAVGGDGTVSEVAAGILGTRARLAIVPNGSTNVVSRNFNIPNETRRAARALIGTLESRTIDVIKIENRIALHMVGCGFDALMMEDTAPMLKRTAAWFAYVPAALKHMSGRPWTFRITVDDRQISTDAKMVLVANGSFVLDPRFEVGRNIRPDDGLLDVIVFTPPNFAATTEIASRMAIGRIESSSYVRQFTGKHIVVESDPPAPVECDGDVIGTTPVTLDVIPGAITIVVPAREPMSETIAARVDETRPNQGEVPPVPR